MKGLVFFIEICKMSAPRLSRRVVGVCLVHTENFHRRSGRLARIHLPGQERPVQQDLRAPEARDHFAFRQAEGSAVRGWRLHGHPDRPELHPGVPGHRPHRLARQRQGDPGDVHQLVHRREASAGVPQGDQQRRHRRRLRGRQPSAHDLAEAQAAGPGAHGRVDRRGSVGPRHRGKGAGRCAHAIDPAQPEHSV